MSAKYLGLILGMLKGEEERKKEKERRLNANPWPLPSPINEIQKCNIGIPEAKPLERE